MTISHLKPEETETLGEHTGHIADEVIGPAYCQLPFQATVPGGLRASWNTWCKQ